MTKMFWIKLGVKKRGHQFDLFLGPRAFEALFYVFSINFLPPFLLQMCIKIACAL